MEDLKLQKENFRAPNVRSRTKLMGQRRWSVTQGHMRKLMMTDYDFMKQSGYIQGRCSLVQPTDCNKSIMLTGMKL